MPPTIETNYSARNKTKTEYQEIDLTLIYASPDNPRKHFDAPSLNDLADSIRIWGVMEPVILREIEGGYALIDGERRFRAARLANRTHIPAAIHQCSELDGLLMGFVANQERENLDPIAVARAYHTMIVKFQLTQEQIADKARCSQEAISHAIRLLSLPAEGQTLISEGVLTASHGKELCRLSDYPDQARHYARLAAEEVWSTRKLGENIASFLTSQREKDQPRLTISEEPSGTTPALQAFMTTEGEVAEGDLPQGTPQPTANDDDDGPMSGGGSEDVEESNDTPSGYDPSGYDPKSPVRLADLRPGHILQSQSGEKYRVTSMRTDRCQLQDIASGKMLFWFEPELQAEGLHIIGFEEPVSATTPSVSQTPEQLEERTRENAASQLVETIDKGAASQPQTPLVAPASVPTPARPASTPTATAVPSPAPSEASPQSAMVQCVIPNILDDWLWEIGVGLTNALELLRRIHTCAEASNSTLQDFVTRIESETFHQ